MNAAGPACGGAANRRTVLTTPAAASCTQAAILAFVARMLPLAPPGAYMWAALYVAGSAAAMALGHAGSRWGLDGRWRWRWRLLQLPTLCVRTCDLGIGGVCAAMHASVVQQQAHAAAAAAAGAADGSIGWAAVASATRFIYASGACNLALLIGVLRLPPG